MTSRQPGAAKHYELIFEREKATDAPPSKAEADEERVGV
jgi:hypothetical protein